MASKIRGVVLPLVIANAVLFLIQMVYRPFTDMFMLVPSDVFARPWILITSMFLHASFGHIFFNMYALLMFGSLIEQRIGSKRFLITYFSCGAIASLVYSLVSSAPALGASGAIMGILGLTIMLMPDLQILLFFFIPMSMRTAGIAFVVIEILGIFGLGFPGIANTAHLAGLFCGLAYGLYLKKQKKTFQKRFVIKPKKKNIINASFGNTVEMSDSEIEEYLRYGKL